MIFVLAQYFLSPRYADRNLRLKAKVKLVYSAVGFCVALWAAQTTSADQSFRALLHLLQIECCLDVIGFVLLLSNPAYGVDIDPEVLRPHPQNEPLFTEEEVFRPNKYHGVDLSEPNIPLHFDQPTKPKSN